MKYSLTTQHLTLSSLDQQQLDEKLNRLQRFLLHPYTFAVVLRHDTHHRQGAVITCIFTVTMDGRRLHTERVAATVQDAVDAAIGALKKELTKQRDQHKRRRWSIKRWIGW